LPFFSVLCRFRFLPIFSRYSSYRCFRFRLILVLGYECQEYNNLDSQSRRADLAADYWAQDVFFGTKSWYRITGSAGNQVANHRVKSNFNRYFCAGARKGWIKGTLPSVEEGEVQRQVLFIDRFGFKNDYYKTMTKIRNCDEFFVYQFPLKTRYVDRRICSQYKHGKYLRNIL
jgi:hypothetical protein